MAVLGSAPLSPSTSRLGMPTDQVQPSPCPRLLLTIAHTSGPADPHGKTESALFLKHRAELLASLSLIPCSACGVQNFLPYLVFLLCLTSHPALSFMSFILRKKINPTGQSLFSGSLFVSYPWKHTGLS